MANTREVIAVLLDVGSTMSKHGKSTKVVEDCVRGITSLIEKKILFYPKDQVAVVLFGTNRTDNALARVAPGSYQHVSVLQSVNFPDVALLKRLQDVKPEQANSDFVDALIVGIDMLAGVPPKKGYSTNLRLFLVTDAGGEVNAADLKIIKDKMLELRISLNVVGVDFADEGDHAAEMDVKEASPSQGASHGAPSPLLGVKMEEKDELESWSQSAASSSGDGPVKPEARGRGSYSGPKNDPSLINKRRNESILKDMCSYIKGAIVPVHEALDLMNYFATRAVGSTPSYRGYLEIGTVVKIPVWTYLKTKEETLPRLASISKLGVESSEASSSTRMEVEEGTSSVFKEAKPEPSSSSSVGVIVQRTYHAMDNPDEEIPEDQRMRGFKYGKAYVPASDLKGERRGENGTAIPPFTTEPCLKVIGFTPESSVARHFFTSNTDMIVPYSTDDAAAQAVSALCHAMTRTGMVGIVRVVKRKNSAPMLGIITPKIGEHSDFFYLNRLPFNDDLRLYGFASLIETEHTPIVPKHTIPSEKQLNVTEDLINAMDLSDAAMDSYGQPMEALKPKYTFNPTLQYFYQVVLHRALKPNLPVPPMDASILGQIKMDPAKLRKASGAMSQFRDAFVLTKTESKEKENRKRFWSSAFAGEEIDDKLESYLGEDNKKSKKKEDDVTPAGLHNIQALLRGGVDSVGNLTPVEDFLAMMARRDVDLVDKAIQELQAQILLLVNDSYKNSLYDKAIECINALRAGCIKEQESEQFNQFLQVIKSTFKGKQRNDFWMAVQQKAIQLISSAESGDSTVSLEEVRDFYASDPAPQDILSIDDASKPSDKQSGTAEDLFDLL